MTKDFRGSDAAAKAWLRGEFHSKERKCPKHSFSHLYYSYKRDRLAITVHSCSLRQNRRATGARIWGSVRSKIIFGASVAFNILKLSTGLAFPTGSLTRDDYG